MTCPKISSSVSTATAKEKIMPATTAMNVIAICITPPRTAFKMAGVVPNFNQCNNNELAEILQAGSVVGKRHCVDSDTVPQDYQRTGLA
jgi:hypothetical protein